MVELANIIEFISKKIALDSRKFKSRLIFKAVAEIFQRELKKAGKHTIKIDQLKESMKGVTNNLVNHSNNCKDLIAKHASNVLQDGMTILVHSKSKSTMEVLKQASDRGIRINVIATES